MRHQNAGLMKIPPGGVTFYVNQHAKRRVETRTRKLPLFQLAENPLPMPKKLGEEEVSLKERLTSYPADTVATCFLFQSQLVNQCEFNWRQPVSQ